MSVTVASRLTVSPLFKANVVFEVSTCDSCIDFAGQATNAREVLVVFAAVTKTFAIPGMRDTTRPEELIWPTVESEICQLNDPTELVTSTPLLKAVAVNCSD